MKTVFRRVALVAALLGAFSAQAGVVTKTLDFDDLGASAPADGAVIGDHYKSEFGVIFGAGGRVYNTAPPTALPGSKGYLSNTGDTGFSINVDAAVDYDLLTIDFALGSVAFSLRVNDRDMGTTGWLTLAGTPGTWVWAEKVVIDLSNIGNISSIDFEVTQNSSFFAVDNINFGRTTSDGGGGTVPEPASYGLVAMTLLAAGWASRRRAR